MISVSQADFGVTLALFTAIVPMQIWRLQRLHAEQLKTDRYALFAVRDRWIRLVAEGHLDECDKLFQFLYEEINNIVPSVKPLTLRNIVAALSKSRVIKDPAFRRQITELLEHKDARVQKVVHEFFNALMNILFGRSIFVRLSVLLTHSGVQALSRVREVLSHLMKTESEAYRIHKTLRGMCPV